MTGDIKQGPKGQANVQGVGDMPLQEILNFFFNKTVQHLQY